MYPPSKREEVIELLDSYGAKLPERTRVHLAILKFSYGRLDKLHQKVDLANLISAMYLRRRNISYNT